MEAGANLHPANHFVLINQFGKYYLVETISGTEVPSCKWCAYFTPSTSPPVPTYEITADVNNFILPLSGGALTMKYETSCSSATIKSDIYDKIRNLNLPSKNIPHRQKMNIQDSSTNFTSFFVAIIIIAVVGGAFGYFVKQKWINSENIKAKPI